MVEGAVLDATICDVRQEELVGRDPPMPAQIRPERDHPLTLTLARRPKWLG